MFLARTCFTSLALSLMLMAGCANPPVPASPEVVPATTIKPFPAQTLEALLIAEFAGVRQQPDLAVRHYTEQARETGDLEIVRRATLIAQHFNREDETLLNAELWHTLDPQADEPTAVLASLKLREGKLVESFDYSIQLLDKGFEPPFQSIAAQAAQKSPADRAALLDRFNAAIATHRKEHNLLHGKALLLLQNGHDDQALEQALEAIDAEPTDSAACLLAASLLEKKQKKPGAGRLLARRMKEQPYDTRVHLQYARLLSTYDLPKAQQEFKALVERNPQDSQLLLALALVSREAGDTAAAREYFEQLLFIQQHVSIAYYYLGEMAEKNNDVLRAMEHYRRVTEGEEYLYAVAAYCRLAIKENNLTGCLLHLDSERKRLPEFAIKLYVYEASVMLEQKQYNAGIALLNRALASHAQDIDLLYSRSLLLETQGDLAGAEKDLRSILDKQPENANGLNALGYMLANRTDRLDEAFSLINRALELEPDNAAITDSMGWVLYKLGKPAEALPYLEKAMQQMPSHEVAAHLGEVLWILGNQKQARKIWKRGIEDNPDSDILMETFKRLQVK